MSTKIYNGYRIKACSLQELQEKMLSIRPEMEAALKRMILSGVCHLAVNVIDFNAVGHGDLLGLDIKLNSPIFNSWAYLTEKISKSRRSIEKTGYDYGCSAVLIPSGEYFLAILYSDQQAYTDIWNKHVEYYGYWNNTDQPDDLTDEQWETRKTDWDRALGERAIPSIVGFTYDFVSGPDFIDVVKNDDAYEFIEKNITIEHRCKIADEIKCYEYIDRRRKEDQLHSSGLPVKVDNTSIPEQLRANSYFAYVGEFREKAKGELKAEIEAYREQLRLMLPVLSPNKDKKCRR